MSLTDPAAIMARLEGIDADLAERQNRLEEAAMRWFRSKRDREKARADTWLKAEGTVAERNAVADRETALMGASDEAQYEALKAVVRVLDTRASIGQSLLRAQSRAGA